jgi:diguanylate cyclase (GGDEF)-like protein
LYIPPLITESALYSPTIQGVLAKLIALTSERDVNALEISLAHALFELVAPGAVAIYKLEDVHSKKFALTVMEGGDVPSAQIPADLQHMLEQCVATGQRQQYVRQDGETVTLYPVSCAKNKPLAVIGVTAPEVAGFDQITGMLLQVYQNFIALINDNEQDTLTGLLNRKTFEHKVNKVVTRVQNRHQREDDALGLHYYMAIFDIDHFKLVNDRYGHLLGDEVLLLFAQQMTYSLRDHDLLFRFGGEEFVAIFECHDQQEMQMVLDRFRERVAEFEFPQVGRITVSAGYTEIMAYDVSSHIIDRADVALYYAKHHGRNRVCNYERLVAEGALENKRNEGGVELF